MKFAVVIFLLLALTATGYYYLTQAKLENPNNPTNSQKIGDVSTESLNSDIPAVTKIAEGLDTPWGIAFLPDRSLLITERSGRVRIVDANGSLDPKPVATLSKVLEIGEGGLLGIALHPDFSSNNYVYLYYTYSSSGDNTLNRVVRLTLRQAQGRQYQLTDEQVIVDSIPGAANHNGGRIKFGPDNLLYITTGDAQEPSLAQNTSSLAGKILRVTDEGKAVSGNLTGLVYSYGHRNPQGLAWDDQEQLWSTEHGPSGGTLGIGNDEVNLIQAGKNYGWPTIQGDQIRSGMEKSKKHSGTFSTWAPAGTAFVNGSIFFGGLRGTALFEAVVDGEQVVEFKEHFKGEFGRIRDVVTGPDGMLYITTSNLDGRGSPRDGDDKIIRINLSRY